MPQDLEAEAEALFHKWLDIQDEIIPEGTSPFDYIYFHASPELKAYYDGQEIDD